MHPKKDSVQRTFNQKQLNPTLLWKRKKHVHSCNELKLCLFELPKIDEQDFAVKIRRPKVKREAEDRKHSLKGKK